ncbi:MAG: hypothetical protein ACYSOS_04175 [Planctomycetota bacterium]|jgi:hypothetical protein
MTIIKEVKNEKQKVDKEASKFSMAFCPPSYKIRAMLGLVQTRSL